MGSNWAFWLKLRFLEAIEIDYIDESDVISSWWSFPCGQERIQVPFVCGAKGTWVKPCVVSLKGASMIRTRRARNRRHRSNGSPYAYDESRNPPHSKSPVRTSYMLLPGLASTCRVVHVSRKWKVPVEAFTGWRRGSTSNYWLLWCNSVRKASLSASGDFQVRCPVKRAAAIVKAVTNYQNPQILAQISEDLGLWLEFGEDVKILMAERGK